MSARESFASWQGDHEGRPYISSRTAKTCRGDPRGRPQELALQKSYAHPDFLFEACGLLGTGFVQCRINVDAGGDE